MLLQAKENEIPVENLEISFTSPINKENESILCIELEERKSALMERQVNSVKS